MNYKQAKQLKDAGFEQALSIGDMYFDFDMNEAEYPRQYCGEGHKNNDARVPTLSELIEEIEGFRSLHISGQEWEACSVFTCAIGKEKDTSVAKLWLKSNEKTSN